jgi:hypothetical protein
MAGTRFHCFANYRALIPRTATNNTISLAISFPMFRGLPTPALRPNTNHAGGSGLWQSALKFGPLTIALRGTAIFSVAIRLENTAISQCSVMNLSAEFSKRVESSPRHFTSRGPCLNCHIFLTRDF